MGHAPDIDEEDAAVSQKEFHIDREGSCGVIERGCNQTVVVEHPQRQYHEHYLTKETPATVLHSPLACLV